MKKRDLLDALSVYKDDVDIDLHLNTHALGARVPPLEFIGVTTKVKDRTCIGLEIEARAFPDHIANAGKKMRVTTAWKPMEAAPLDGTNILLYWRGRKYGDGFLSNDTEKMLVGYWLEDHDMWHTFHHDYQRDPDLWCAIAPIDA